jgi:HD-GYP domain-containing protein (c-di-GMP phosphodiesterase class II)
MNEVTLKKLFSLPKGLKVIEKIVSDLNVELGVYDGDGKLIWGQDCKGSSPSFASIEANDRIAGYVHSDRYSEALASLLTYLLKKEEEENELAQGLSEKNREINLLYHITENINAAINLKEAAQFIIGVAVNYIKTTHASLMLWEEKRQQLETIATHGLKQKLSGSGIDIDRIIFSVLEQGKPRVINDVIHNGNRFSFMCAPLKTRDKIIGVINISHENKIQYTATDLKFFSTLASQAAMVIENARLYSQLRNTFLATANVLVETIEKRDPYTGGHTKRVMDYALEIGKSLLDSEKEMTRLRLAAILHDVGKIGVRDKILLKQSELDQEEIKNIESHTILGEDILKSIEHLDDILPSVRHHHERFDGTGYPDKLAGEQIDLIARIIAVADAYDAMTSNRPYREALSHDQAVSEIKKGRQTQFDPVIVDIFLRIFDNK